MCSEGKKENDFRVNCHFAFLALDETYNPDEQENLYKDLTWFIQHYLFPYILQESIWKGHIISVEQPALVEI